MSVLESMRSLHEESEQHTNNAVNDLVEQPTTARDRIMQEHRLITRMERIKKNAKELLQLYDEEDDGNPRKQELEDISGEDAIETFYERLKATRTYHHTHPAAGAVKAVDSYEIKPAVRFSPEEFGGKYVDMLDLHARYINMPHFDKKDNYIAFLVKLDQFHHIEKDLKLKGDDYKKYEEDVLRYLMDFYQRTNPLVDVSKLMVMIDEDFSARWEAKAIPAWFELDKKEGEPDESADHPAERNVAIKDPALWCEACAKQFEKPGPFDSHLKGKKHKKAVELLSGAGTAQAALLEAKKAKQAIRVRTIAEVEERIKAFVELLRDVIDDTRSNIEKKQTRTWDEIQEEQEKQETQAVLELEVDSDPDEEKPIYNPLNLPLGWDGKPIPYWLYKLHGLNIEYKCEICGNYSYWGPRAFERHFKDWRHSYGMKCLGIPNTKHFHNITRFQEAQHLWDKLKKTMGTSDWKPEDEEEFEDHEGNVFAKKTFEELKRQGII